jgi:hypothetical protein
MEKAKVIWDHEKEQADKLTRSLIDTKGIELSLKSLFNPFLQLKRVRMRRNLKLTRNNLLFTKQLAFDAARNISMGKNRTLEMNSIEMKTKNILAREKKGFYTEKVRRKQLQEIALLIDHYLGLLTAKSTSYSEMVKALYQSKKNYLSFLSKLQKAEQAVIQAAIITMSRGSRKDRLEWFRKVTETNKKITMEEADGIFPEE